LRRRRIFAEQEHLGELALAGACLAALVLANTTAAYAAISTNGALSPGIVLIPSAVMLLAYGISIVLVLAWWQYVPERR